MQKSSLGLGPLLSAAPATRHALCSKLSSQCKVVLRTQKKTREKQKEASPPRRRTVRLSGCEINAIKGVKTPPRQYGATVQHELLKQLDRLQPKFSGTQDTLRTTFIDKTKTLRQLRSGGTITQAAAPGSPLERGKYSR